MSYLHVYFADGAVPKAVRALLLAEPKKEDPPGVWYHGTAKVWHGVAEQSEGLEVKLRAAFEGAEFAPMFVNSPTK